MAEPVAERPGERALLDDARAQRVGVDRRQVGADRLERGELRGEHDLVRLLRLVVERTGRERARVVGCVAVDGAAGVDHDELAGLDRPVGRARVRSRSGRPGADDRLEREPVAAFLVEEPRQVPRHLALGAADERHLGEALEDAVGDRARVAEDLELALLLHRAQRLDEARVRHELEPAALERLEVGVDDVRRLERDPARQLLGERTDHAALRLHELDALDGTRRLDVPEVGEELDALLVDEQRRVRALEAGEVDDVLRRRDEERLLDQRAEAFDASVHAFSFRYSRAIR